VDGLSQHREGENLDIQDGCLELRALTGSDHGRIFESVQRIASNGAGDTRCKISRALDRSTGGYKPCIDINQDTTTLYASDRDVFLLLVDYLNPIEAGRPPDGPPDLCFRGF
jgi:hypothetical protein